MNTTPATCELTDATPMPFGKRFLGKPMRQVPAKYLLYIYENNFTLPDNLKKYITNNLNGLYKEAGRGKR